MKFMSTAISLVANRGGKWANLKCGLMFRWRQSLVALPNLIFETFRFGKLSLGRDSSSELLAERKARKDA